LSVSCFRICDALHADNAQGLSDRNVIKFHVLIYVSAVGHKSVPAAGAQVTSKHMKGSNHMPSEDDKLNEALLAYLRTELNAGRIAYQSLPVQIQGGFETQIYRFQLQDVPEPFSQPLILRLYPARYADGNARWEHTVQNALASLAYPAARAHLLCTDLSILGGAFFIMDFLPGKPLVNAPMEMVPRLLGQSHAHLHSIDPHPLVEAIHAAGIDRKVLFPEHRFNSFRDQANKFPWLDAAMAWLVKNCPPDPGKLAICHGDFHPLNILVQDGRVSGVLDWPGLMVADPVLDIAFTLSSIGPV
jgi:aminoglycoside phosphotransferase (APT) family kinase protein